MKFEVEHLAVISLVAIIVVAMLLNVPRTAANAAARFASQRFLAWGAHPWRFNGAPFAFRPYHAPVTKAWKKTSAEVCS